MRRWNCRGCCAIWVSEISPNTKFFMVQVNLFGIARGGLSRLIAVFYASATTKHPRFNIYFLRTRERQMTGRGSHDRLSGATKPFQWLSNLFLNYTFFPICLPIRIIVILIIYLYLHAWNRIIYPKGRLNSHTIELKIAIAQFWRLQFASWVKKCNILQFFWQLKWVVNDTRSSELINWLHIKFDLKLDLVTIYSALRGEERLLRRGCIFRSRRRVLKTHMSRKILSSLWFIPFFTT